MVAKFIIRQCLLKNAFFFEPFSACCLKSSKNYRYSTGMRQKIHFAKNVIWVQNGQNLKLILNLTFITVCKCFWLTTLENELFAILTDFKSASKHKLFCSYQHFLQTLQPNGHETGPKIPKTFFKMCIRILFCIHLV
jgi:hypothetical protein